MFHFSFLVKQKVIHINDSLTNFTICCKSGIYAGQSKTFYVPSGSRHLFAITTLNQQATALYSLGATGAGIISWIPMVEPQNPLYVFTRDGNKFIIQDNASISLDFIFINVSGNPITVIG